MVHRTFHGCVSVPVYAELMSYLESCAESRVAVCPALAGHVRQLRDQAREQGPA